MTNQMNNYRALVVSSSETHDGMWFSSYLRSYLQVQEEQVRVTTSGDKAELVEGLRWLRGETAACMILAWFECGEHALHRSIGHHAQYMRAFVRSLPRTCRVIMVVNGDCPVWEWDWLAWRASNIDRSITLDSLREGDGGHVTVFALRPGLDHQTFTHVNLMDNRIYSALGWTLLTALTQSMQIVTPSDILLTQPSDRLLTCYVTHGTQLFTSLWPCE